MNAMENEVYKLGKGEGAKDPSDGAYGDIVTNSGGKGWIRYNFDIRLAGGEAGDWRFYRTAYQSE